MFKSEEEVIDSPLFIVLAPFIFNKYKDKLHEKIDYLYHYTNLEGLMGIIDTIGFWATHIKYMNDSKEYLHGISLCNEIIENVSKNATDDQVKFLNKVSERLNEEDSESFVISICPNGDLLSQWRGYSRGQYGISIGFDVSQLCQFTTPRDNEYLFPQKVIYEIDVQKNIISDIIDIGLKNIESQGLELYFIPSEIATTIKRFISLFKDSSFSEEKEWRIVTTNFKETEGGHPLRYRVRNNIVLPFVSLPLRKLMKEEKENLPIKNIVVGPSDSIEFTMDSLKYFLKGMNYHSTEVLPSSTPYR